MAEFSSIKNQSGKRAETMKANFIIEKLKPLIPRLGNNEALKLHLNRAILNANGDFKLAIKNIENIPDGNLPTPTRNLLNEFKNALKDIEQVVKSQANEPTQIKAENQVNLSKTKEPTQEPVKAEAKKEAENLAQYRKDIETKYNINPIKEFGTNYAEFYHDGANAIRKLLVERQGQVAGAFERKELGDIDLVWGEAKAANGDIKGYGLSKIEAKHLNDFASFYGDTPQEKLINGLNEIIKNGKIINENGVDTIWYKKDNDYYLIGLSKGFYNKGDNNWIITAYEKTNLSIDKKARIDKALKGGDSKTISAYAEIKSSKTPKLTTAENSTTTVNKSQAKNMMGGFSTMAMEKAILHLGSGAAGGAINANAEQDPDKKAEAFLKGFLLGAGGSVGAIKMLENSAKLAPQLARISQRLANDLPVILNDRPDIVGKALGKTPKDNYNYIFGGENAIGANKAKLKTAREMVKNGADESQIWTKTGWYKDIDGKWKFEINPLGGKFKKVIKDLFDAKAFKEKNREKLEVLQDRAKINDKYQTNLNNLNATLSQQASIITKAKDGLKLSEVLDDKKLFNAYPQLRDLKVRFDELDSQMSMYDGYYNKTLDEIVLNSKLYNKPEMLRSILYHEIQHKIQSIEGFASGGGYFSDITKVEKLLEKYPNDADLQNLYDGLKYNYVSDSAEYNVYRKLAGEAEARNVQTRLTANSKEHPNKTLDINPNERIVKFDSDMSASYTPNSSVLKEQKDKLGIELANMDEKAQADTIKLYENAKSADEKHNALKMAMLSNRSDEFRPISHINLSDISDKEAQDLAKKIQKHYSSADFSLYNGGEYYTISNRGKGKIARGYEAIKEYDYINKAEYLAVAGKLDYYFNNSRFLGKHRDLRSDNDLTDILFFRSDAKIHGNNVQILFTLKEVNKGVQKGKRVYAMGITLADDAGKLIRLDSDALPATSGATHATGSPTATPATASNGVDFSANSKISQDLPKWADKFKAKMTKMGQEYSDEKIANLANWHKDSHPATKEKDGSPKVFYHGTNANFDAFDINKLKGSWLGKSFYFTDTKQKAKGYGKNVMSIYLNIKNPYISKAIDNYGFVKEVKEQFNVKENYGEFDPAQVLKEHGYDGVVYKDWNDDIGYIYTAFSPNQIKSISNNGAFNPNSNMMGAYTKVGLPIALVGGGLGYMGTQSIVDGYKNKDTANQTRAKQYAKFLAEAKEPTQVAPNELYKAYKKAKKDIEKPTKKNPHLSDR
ncbi:LPD23 domain-containing protein [Campylobacter porcelli]|uniref:Phage-Barnase-EndoU-ColicinE5/D-RelE-like nuclease domain-containing protein n=1 Tax=Campylobacter porcelli TaxID=1660073 RepID=A0A1X9SW42_9BACT|nr:LPD23 domain-containing protein [Campylobacter sp. RM6137]ARR00487.1 hypothetical protein CSUIS_0671 [Campylobacter sp. RM6137]